MSGFAQNTVLTKIGLFREAELETSVLELMTRDDCSVAEVPLEMWRSIAREQQVQYE